MRLPSSVSEFVSSFWLAGFTSFQPRMISGAWLEANTPTSLAMARPRRRVGAGGAHFFQEIGLGHSGNYEIKPQEIRVDPRREEGHVVALDRGPHFRLQRTAVQNLLPSV